MRFNKKQKLVFALVTLAFAAAAFSLTKNTKHNFLKVDSEEDEAREHNAYPNDWFFSQRAYPYQTVPQTTLVEGIKQTQNLKSLLDFNLTTTWTAVGPTNVGGRVTSIAGTAQDPDLLYIGTADGGVWKTTDRGSHFLPIFDDQGTLSIGDVAIDPKNSQIVWVGTGEANPSGDSYSGLGIYQSFDGGRTFKKKGLENVGRISKIVIDPTDSRKIYVAALGDFHLSNRNRGVYKTIDGGTTWSQVLFVQEDTGATELVMNSQNPQILYAAMWELHRTPDIKKFGGPHSGIYKTLDGGGTWTELKNGLPTPTNDTGRIGLGISATEPDTLYATYDVALNSFEGLYRTKDGGANWTRSNGSADISGINSSYGWWFGHVAVDPKNADTVYVVGFYVAKSTDGGNSFSDWTGGLHPDNHVLYFTHGATNAIFLGNDSGLYLRENASITFRHFNLPITQFYSMAFDPLHPEQLYAGAQDNGTVRTKTGALSDWEHIYQGCDGFEVQIDPRNSTTVFAECQYGNLGRSRDGAQTFTDLQIPFVRAGWEMPIRLHSLHPDVLYAGGESLYVSPDQGDSWKKISPDLTTGTSQTAAITTFDVSLDQQVIYAGTDNGHAWVTRDAGANWTELKGLPNRWITRIRGRPTNPAELYVTVSGFRWGETAAQVFKSLDYGTTWTPLNGGLPDAPVNDILFDPVKSNKMYLANDFGVYVTVDGGQSWKPFGSGIPITSVVELKIDTRNNLLAVTHGRGIYRLSLGKIRR